MTIIIQKDKLMILWMYLIVILCIVAQLISTHLLNKKNGCGNNGEIKLKSILNPITTSS